MFRNDSGFTSYSIRDKVCNMFSGRVGSRLRIVLDSSTLISGTKKNDYGTYEGWEVL